MRREFGSLVFFLIAVLTVPASAQDKALAKNFQVKEVAENVFAVIRKEPPSLWFNPNNVFIIGKAGAIVVDSNISSEYTREVIDALRKITDKPVRYVINTHWHEDHIIGNRAYRDAFPNVKFIGHRSTLTDLPTVGAANRRGSLENGQGFVDLLRRSIDNGENLVGQKLTEEEREGYESDIRLVGSYLAESSKFEIILPTVLVDDRLEIEQDGRKIEILHLGRAHTAADLVVRLPKENILISGDLIVHPVPLVGSTSYPLEYAATLERLLALKPKVIVPGHGPVMRDTSYLISMIDLLSSITQQAQASAKRGETLEEMRKSIDLERFRKIFAGESQHKSLVFRNYVVLPATAAAHRQLAERAEAPLNSRRAVSAAAQ